MESLEKNKWYEVLKWPVVSLIVVVVGRFTQAQFVEWIGTIAGIVTVTPIIVEWVKVKLNLSGKKILWAPASRFVTWIMVALLCLFSWFFGFGFENMSVWQLAIYAVVGGGAANKFYGPDEMQYFLALIFGRMEKVETMKAIFALRKK